MESTKTLVIVLMALLRVTISKPTCTTYGEKDVVCTAGADDFILRRHFVSDNNKTTGITLKECRITDIKQESFYGLTSLKYLDLSLNKIQEMKLGVLDGSKEMTYLNLSHNLLTGFDLGLFDQKPNLELLDLKGNKISEIKLGVLDPLKKLRHLDLSSNLLIGKYMNPFIFDRCNGIRFMDFSRNVMSDTPDNMLHALKELEVLNLDRCSLNDVPSFIKKPNISTLKHLILSTNAIKVIHDTDFRNFVSLEILDLTSNRIRSVADNAFKFSRNLKVILLRYNELQSIPETLFQSVPLLNSVDLSHNKIQLIPVNAFRGTKIKNINVSDNRFTYLQDNFCLELRNSGVMLSKFYFNQNPWQCACLMELLKEVKQYGISYNHAKYNGREAVCVTEKEFTCKRQPQFNEVFNSMFFDDVN